MGARREKSFYEIIEKKAGQRFGKEESGTLELHRTIRDLRSRKGLSGIDLCRRAGDLDAKTLTAVEKGRIRNPSIKTLLSVARGLGVTVGDLFHQAEIRLDRNLYSGSQKGAFQMEFPQWGVRIVSFTPLIHDFFCGKLILAPKRKITEAVLHHPLPL